MKILLFQDSNFLKIPYKWNSKNIENVSRSSRATQKHTPRFIQRSAAQQIRAPTTQRTPRQEKRVEMILNAYVYVRYVPYLPSFIFKPGKGSFSLSYSQSGQNNLPFFSLHLHLYYIFKLLWNQFHGSEVELTPNKLLISIHNQPYL